MFSKLLNKLCLLLFHIYLFVILHVVQVCLLTDAEIEEFLPLVSYGISLGLEMWCRELQLIFFEQMFKLIGNSGGWVQIERFSVTVRTSTCMVALAGCFSSTSLSPSSWNLFTSLSWDKRLLFLKFWWRSNQRGFITWHYIPWATYNECFQPWRGYTKEMQESNRFDCLEKQQHPAVLTSYCLRTSGGSTMRSLQSCLLILSCSSPRKASSLVQPCMYSYRLFR